MRMHSGLRSQRENKASLDRAICDRIAGTIRISKFASLAVHDALPPSCVEWASEVMQTPDVAHCRWLGEQDRGNYRRCHTMQITSVRCRLRLPKNREDGQPKLPARRRPVT